MFQWCSLVLLICGQGSPSALDADLCVQTSVHFKDLEDPIYDCWYFLGTQLSTNTRLFKL
jgi:hypothetical protein